ncbi:MAG: FISUMP domain-containing protein [Tenuifilaceae bacterium]
MKRISICLIALVLLFGFKVGLTQPPDWTRVLQTNTYGVQFINAVTSDVSNNVYFAAGISGPVTYDGSSFTSVGLRDLLIAKTTSTGASVWKKQISITAGGSISAITISVDASGNVYVLATFSGSLTIGSSNITSSVSVNSFIAKFDVSGNGLWASAFLSTGAGASRIALDASGNIYLISSTTKLLKYNSSGAFQWEQIYPNYTLQAIAIYGSNLYLGGALQAGTTTFGSIPLTNTGGYNTGFLVKGDLNGAYSISTIVGGSTTADGSTVSDIALDGSGNLIITGVYTQSLILGTITISNTAVSSSNYTYIAKCNSAFTFSWSKSSTSFNNSSRVLFGYRLFTDSSNNIYEYGPVNTTLSYGSATSSSNHFVFKFDAAGNALNSYDLSTIGFFFQRLIVGQAGQILLGSSYNYSGSSSYGNFHLTQYNNSLVQAWDKASSNCSSGTVKINYVKHDSGGNTFIQSRVLGNCNYFGTVINTNNNVTVISKHNISGTLLWMKQISDINPDLFGPAFTLDKDNNVLTTGLFLGSLVVGTTTITTTNTGNEGYVAKYSSSGDFLWVSKLNLGVDVTTDMTVASDNAGNVVVSGVINPANYLVKFDPSGNQMWAKTFPMESYYLSLISTDASNNIYLTSEIHLSDNTGTTTIGTVTLNQTDNDGATALVKFDSNGNALWAKTYGGVAGATYSDGWACDIKTDAAGNSYLWGWCRNNSIFGTTTLVNPFATNQDYSFYLAKINTAGDVVWAKAVYETQFAFNYGDVLDLDQAGNIYVGGHFKDKISIEGTEYTPTGTNDFFIAKYSNSGVFQWIKTIPAGSNIINALSVFSNDVLTIVGAAGINPALGSTTINSKGGSNSIVATLGTLASDLVAFYPFNGNANDESGNGNNGTNNGATLTTDRFGNANSAYSFDGASNYIIGSADNLPVGERTVSLWTNITSLPDNSVPFGYGGISCGESWVMFVKNAEYPNMYNIQGHCNVNGLVGNYPQDPINKWVFISVTTNSTGTVIYINGNPISNNSTFINNTYVSGKNFIIGATINSNGIGVSGGYLNGKIDDIRIFSRALSATEIEALYHEGGYYPVTDIDGNTYESVQIGNQIWMKQNLKTTRYSNGEAIPNVTDNAAWAGLTSAAFCNYNNDEATANIYGKLYNFYAVADSRNLCPAGWHVPTDAELFTLENYVDPTIIDPNATGWLGTDGGTKLKATSSWNSGGNGTDNFGFTALAGGSRDFGTGVSNGMGNDGTWWSITENTVNNPWVRSCFYYNPSTMRYVANKRYGYSVRCLKDDLNNGLVAYYPFNSNTNDESGNGNNGTNNGATLTSDRFGNASSAYLFDGVDDHIKGSATNFPIGERTVSIWFKANDVNSQPTIFGYGGGTCGTSWFQGLNHSNMGGYMVTSHCGTNSLNYVYNSDPINKWTQWVITTSNSGTKMYVDGVLILSDPLFISNTVAYLTDFAIGVGVDPNGVAPYIDGNMGYFDGYLDDIRIYNRALSSTEIDALYHEGGYYPVTDIDGNTYETVQIGTQVWMKQNLKVKHYRNGDAIPYEINNGTWAAQTAGACCNYNNDELLDNDYGKLYNFFAVADSRNLCPAGWHVPSDAEWTILETYLGGTSVAAGKLKEAGIAHWTTPNAGTTNETGFTALPGGSRLADGTFASIYGFGHWWSSTVSSSSTARYRAMGYDGINTRIYDNNKTLGISVRCLQDAITTSTIPTITSFSPTSGPIGTSVTITGTNFSTTPANNIVWFGAVRATVSAATSTSLSVTVPIGATYQPITVTVNGLTAYSSKPFIVTFSSSGVIDAASFAAKVDFASGVGPEYIAIGDIDGDGKSDLAISNWNDNTISIYRNTSTSGSITTGSFAPKVDIVSGTYPYPIVLGDVDGDNKLDLIVANYGSNTVSVYRNISTSGSISASSFAAKVDFTTGANPNSVSIRDLDGDGRPDLLVVNVTDNTVSILRNLSSIGIITTSSFAPKVDFSTGTSPEGIATGDIDGDGKPDIIVSNFPSNTISVFRNTCSIGSIAASSFDAKINFNTGSGPHYVALGDIDGDSKTDIAVANYYGNSVSVFRNTSTTGSIVTGSLSAKIDFTTGLTPYSVAIGDIDGDGKPDLVAPNNYSGTVSVLKNISTTGSISTGSFTAKVDYTTGTTPVGVIIGDLDGDNKPDLVVTNSGSSTISVLRNTITTSATTPTITSFTPSSGIAGSSVTITGTNFGATQGTSTVKFGATTATVTGWSATQIVATVPSIAAGSYTLSVTTTAGTVNSSTQFTVTSTTPTITSFTPSSGLAGSSVTITGTNFGATQGTSTVKFGATTATATSWSATQIVATVPSITAGNYTLSVTTSAGTVNSSIQFTVTTATTPTITSFTPSSGLAGSSVTITGTNFGTTQGTNTVKFGTTTATATSWSATQIVATVPAITAGNYTLSVTTTAGTGNSVTQFSITSSTAPAITTFNPISGIVGSSVTITGTNFGATQGTSTVKFGTTTATASSWSATQIVANVPNLTEGNYTISITTTAGTATSSSQFAVISSTSSPTITSFTPSSGAIGSSVTIYGTNFGATQVVSTVKFGTTTATPTSWSATQIIVTVPSIALGDHLVYVTTSNGTATSTGPFKVTNCITPTVKKKGGINILICQTQNATSYQWYLNDVAVTGATKQFYVARKNFGSYSVQVVESNGCNSRSGTIVVNTSSRVSIYPNPTSTDFSIILDFEQTGQATIRIINSLGSVKKVITFTKESDSQTLPVEISNLEKGVYFVDVEVNGEKIESQKIVIL